MINIDNFMSSLVIMGEGMFGIFVFMSLFFGIIVALEKMFPVSKE